MQRGAAKTGGARNYRTVFELEGVPAFQSFYETGIFVWKALYRGLYERWHVVPAPTVADGNAVRTMVRLNAAKAVCAELASLVWGEECAVNVSMDRWRSADGSPDPLGAFIRDVLDRNAFGERMQALTEQALALGGAAVKVWYDERGGGPAGDAGGIRLGYCGADQFIPLAWDNAAVTEGVFISRRAKGGRAFTRLEWHTREGGEYLIRNELYRSEAGENGGGRDVLGERCPLGEAEPGLAEEAVVPVDESLFSYFRTPVANNLDDGSPLGVSIYANALETLRALDICYDSFVREFRLGKKRIIVPARAVRSVVDPETNMVRRYFDATDEVYEALASDDPADLKIVDNSVALRVEEHVAALNAFLSILCLQIGFSADTFSFDERGGIRTATEVVSENSKTYKTIRTIQNQLRPAIERMVRNIIEVAALYDVEFEGRSVRRMAESGYHVSVVFDDGVTQDRQTNISEGVMLVGAGLLSRFTFLTDRKYGQGLTPEQAEAELERIRAEQGLRAAPLNPAPT